MSAAQLKAKLKASREAIAAKEWETALDAANDVLSYDASNYNATIFKALSLQNLHDLEASEAAFRDAIQLNRAAPLAWQGLEKLQAETREWDKLKVTLREVMNMALESDDSPRCAEALQKLIDVERREGTETEIADALALLLPGSRYHALLSALPAPDQTAPLSTPYFSIAMSIHVNSLDLLSELISLREKLEERRIENEVEKGRNRLENLSLKREVLAMRVGVEVWSDSELPALYDQLSSHPSATDEQRREAEGKLLRYQHRLLLALPSPPSKAEAKLKKSSSQAPGDEADAEAKRQRKREMREKVAEMAKGMTTIGVPDELAWSIQLEWIDAYSLVDLPMELLRKYVSLFPRHPLSSSFRALLWTIKDEAYLEERREEADKMDVELQTEDALESAITGIEGAPRSVLAQRIAATIYNLDSDFSSSIEASNSALVLLSNLSADVDLDLGLATLGAGVTLGVALTKHHAPQHHAKALRLLYAGQQHAGDDFEAQLAKAHIVAFAERWEQAREDFADVVATLKAKEEEAERVEHAERRLGTLRAMCFSRAPELEARGEMAWCDVKLGRFDEGRKALEDVIDEVDSSKSGEGVSQTDRAKAWWRLGSCLWDMGGELKTQPDNAFTCFITALKRDTSYAPAFTSLGFYYETVASPPDPSRASKCFQKAFELDPREFRAGYKLAEGFAEEQEWELVDVVARRTVEGEGGEEALRGSTTSQRRHVTRNAWAWKAIGSAELQRGQTEAAIVALQICLRSEPEDDRAWQRLGEAYLASGRHTAALKSFAKAQEICKTGWEPAFSTAQVHRQLSEFAEALHILREIVATHPEEHGVRLALAETLLEQGRAEIRAGTTLRAEQSLSLVMHEIVHSLSDGARFMAAWKILGDAAFELSTLGRIADVSTTCGERVEEVLLLAERYDVDVNLPSITAVTRQTLGVSQQLSSTEAPAALLRLAVYLYKLRVQLCAADELLGGAAWTDLAMALHRLSHLGGERDAIAKQAVGCLKEALKLEPRNSSLLMLLGNISFASSFKLAQHCYIQAVEADRRSALPWSSLGFLYLHHDDVELANEAFSKAQTLDPDQPFAWVGQALVAKSHGDEDASRALFHHAIGLCEGAVLEADYGFASSVFSLFSFPHPPPTQQLHAPSFALSAYLSHCPSDATALHLAALISERLGEEARAEQHVRLASDILEKKYEEDEEAETARRYAVCQASLGRILVAAGEMEEAGEVLESCVGLVEGLMDEEGDGGVQISRPLADVRLNASLSLAVAQHGMGRHEAAVETMRGVLQGLEGSGDEDVKARVAVEMARILWAWGTEEAKEEAKSQLLECISNAPQNVAAITSLAAIGLVSGDGDLFEAALSEVQELPADQLRVLDPEGYVTRLLAASCDAQGEGGEARRVLDQAAREKTWSVDAALRAAQAHVKHLANVVVGEEGGEVEETAKATREAVQRAMNVAGSTPGTGAEDISHALRLLAACQALAPWKAEEVDGEDEGGATRPVAVKGPPSALSLAQQAVHVAPWLEENWAVLDLARARGA